MTPIPARRRFLAGLAAFSTLTLAGCGFRLRGPQPLAFSSIFVGMPAQTELGSALRRRLRASGNTTVVDEPSKAEVRLEIVRNERTREILTLTGAGKVREYELRHFITFRLVDRTGAERLGATGISATREYTFDDSQIIAKEQEEALLYRDMQTDLVDQIMRRLAAVKP